MDFPRGKTRVSAKFGIRQDKKRKTFVVMLEVTLPQNRIIEINMETKGVEQVYQLIKSHREEGWIPLEEWEKKQDENYRG